VRAAGAIGSGERNRRSSRASRIRTTITIGRGAAGREAQRAIAWLDGRDLAQSEGRGDAVEQTIP